jgi:DNA-binding MarR family transcriptional regulator
MASHANGAALRLEPLTGYVGYAMRRAQAASFRHLERTAGRLGLTPGQFSLLSVLAANPGVNQGRLAAVFDLDKSTLSPAIHALTRRGLVRRVRSRADGRAWSLQLTASGARLLARMRDRVEAQEQLIAGALRASERARLLHALGRITAALERADG